MVSYLVIVPNEFLISSPGVFSCQRISLFNGVPTLSAPFESVRVIEIQTHSYIILIHRLRVDLK